MSLGPLYVLLGEVSVQVLCPFFNWVICLPGVELCKFLIYFWDQTLVWGIIGKYVLPYCWFSFHFNAVFFSHAEAFYFKEIPFVYSFLYVPWSRGHISESIAAWNVWDFPACVSSKTFNEDNCTWPTIKKIFFNVYFKYIIVFSIFMLAIYLKLAFVNSSKWKYSFTLMDSQLFS